MTDRPVRSIRRADTTTRLDVDQWPDLDKILFEFQAVGFGEATAGPFMFGRAFDAPPMFTHSVVARTDTGGSGPILTIGVTDWIQDEQDMYVGANLWLVVKPVCFEPIYTGSNILENFSMNGDFDRGPEGNELPSRGFWNPGLVWPSQWERDQDPPGQLTPAFDSDGLIVPLRWTQTKVVANQGDFDKRWFFSKENPHQGSGPYHARTLREGSTGGGDHLSAAPFVRCGAAGSFVTYHRVNPGAVVRSTLRAMTSSNTHGEQITIVHEWSDENGTFIKNDIGPQFPTGFMALSYKLHEWETEAPPNTHYARLLWSASRSAVGQGPPASVLDIADIRVSITGGGVAQPFVTQIFDIVMNFEGRHLHGYGNIHKIPPKLAPVKVVLS